MKRYKNISEKEINVAGKTRQPGEEFNEQETQELKNLEKSGYLEKVDMLKEAEKK